MRPLSPAPIPDRARRMRIIATGLLVFMAAAFLAIRSFGGQHPAWGYALAFTEAAMVGGLADWFAVTALFRRPLGLPIPHTAIIPENKDRIAETMAAFLRDNFLTPLVIARRMRGYNIAATTGGYLAQPARGGQSRLRAGAAGLLGDLLECAIDDALSDRLLATGHDDVHEFRNLLITEFRIRQDFTFGDFATTGHGSCLSI